MLCLSFLGGLLFSQEVYDLRIESEPNGCAFKVYDSEGKLKASGVTPDQFKIRSGTRNLTFKAYINGYEIDRKKKSRFSGDTIITFKEVSRKAAEVYRQGARGEYPPKHKIEDDVLAAEPLSKTLPSTSVPPVKVVKSQVKVTEAGDAVPQETPVEKPEKLHDLTVTSDPAGYEFKVFDASGELKTSGKTPASFKVRRSTRDLSFVLYADGKEIDRKTKSRFWWDTQIKFRGIDKKISAIKPPVPNASVSPEVPEMPAISATPIIEAEVRDPEQKEKTKVYTYSPKIHSLPEGYSYKVFDLNGKQIGAGKTPDQQQLTSDTKGFVVKLYDASGKEELASEKKRFFWGDPTIMFWDFLPEGTVENPTPEVKIEKDETVEVPPVTVPAPVREEAVEAIAVNEEKKSWFGFKRFSKTHELTVSSKPQGLIYTVFDADGVELGSGKTPSVTKVSSGSKVKVVLYYEGKEVSSQTLDNVSQNSVVNFLAN